MKTAPVTSLSPPLGARTPRNAGFTLVLTLILLAVVVVLVMGMFTSTTLESRITRNHDHGVQADIGVKSGLARASQLLRTATWSESNVIFRAENTATVTPAGAVAPSVCLVSAVPEVAMTDGGINWTYHALASGATATPDPNVLDVQQLRAATVTEAKPGGELPSEDALPKTFFWQPRPQVFWETVKQPDNDDEASRPVVRYCFWIEDLQGNLDLGSAGNFGAATDPMDPQYAGLKNARISKHHRERPVVRATAGDYANAPGEWYQGFAPGLRTPDDHRESFDRRWSTNQSALYTLLDPTAILDLETLDNELAIARQHPTNGSTTAAARVNLLYAPDVWKSHVTDLGQNPLPKSALARYTEANAPQSADIGRLVNPAARALEENTALGARAYTEMPLVPPYPPPAFVSVLQPKLNLNRVLMQIERGERTRAEAVDLIASHINRHLPEFKNRRGGFPLGGSVADRELNYLKNLAAGMLDYADTDCLPTVDQVGNQYANWGRFYRGCDSAPLVSEQFMRVKWEDVYNSAGRKRVKLSVTFFYELWNMSNRPVQAEFEAAYMTEAVAQAGTTNVKLNDLTNSKYTITNKPVPDGGYQWMPLYLPRADGQENLPNGTVDKTLKTITLPANGYVVLANAPVVIDNIDVGPTSSFITNISISADDKSRYCLRMKAASKSQTPVKLFGREPAAPVTASVWTLIDQPRGTLERYDRNLTFDNNQATRQRFNGTLPGMSYAKNNTNYANNVGDSRAAFYINYFQDVVNYAEGASPWGQNFRRNIFKDKPTAMYSRNRVNQWPDSGHNCSPGPTGADAFGEDVAWGITINPKDSSLSDHISPHHPTILSRRDTLLKAEPASDPLSWDKRAPMRISNAGRFFSATELGNIFDPIMWDPDGGSETSDLTWANHADIGAAAKASERYCGGNTLRIGRMDHSLFRPAFSDVAGPVDTAKNADGILIGPLRGVQPERRMVATALLDLFHCGIPLVDNADVNVTTDADKALDNLRDLTGPLAEIRGHINLNTASYDVLRAVIAGELMGDPLYPPSTQAALPTAARPPRLNRDGALIEAGLIADRIIQSRRDRPFLSTAELSERVVASSKKPDGTANPHLKAVIGGASEYEMPTTPGTLPPGLTKFEWTDALAEEVFARLYNNSTVRSRNFRVFVASQVLKPRRSDPSQLDVVATEARVFQVFIKPVRDPATGVLVDQTVEVTHEREL